MAVTVEAIPVLATIQEGLAAFNNAVDLGKSLVAESKELQLAARVKDLEDKMGKVMSGFTSLGLAQTPDEYKGALKDIADSWNK